MARKRLTQRFPWLIPLRTRQRCFFCFLRMRFDRCKYAAVRRQDLLPIRLFESRCPLYNEATGFDRIYQENKVHNLKLAAAAIDKLVIRPGETFSFYLAARHADRVTPYKEGLVVINGRLTTAPGGGLCQLTNLLFWLFLHAPLTIVERHGHGMKEFPEPDSDAPAGVDATVSEGWLDLKVHNETDRTFQIHIRFDPTHILGQLLADRDDGIAYEVVNSHRIYCRRNGRVFEEVDILQKQLSQDRGTCLSARILYHNTCEIGYPLPEGTPIQEAAL